MKYNIVKFLLLGLVFTVMPLTFSCNKFSELNTNTTQPTKASAEALFTSAEKNLFDIMATADINKNIFRLFAQYWTQTIYREESNFRLTNRPTISDRFAKDFYVSVLGNLKESGDISFLVSDTSAAAQTEKKNKKALIEILMVYSYSILFELYGDMPYKDALDINNLSPKYEDAKTVYLDLADRLDTAIKNLNSTTNREVFKSADLIYAGDITKWKKFANSLKLRMGITLSKVDSKKASSLIQEAVNGGIFNSNDDNCTFPYLETHPNTNPLWVNLVQSRRADFVGSATLVDTMILFKDPRLKYYLDTIKGNVYKGAVYGAASLASSFSNPSSTMKSPTLKGLLLDYAETQFYLAEAVEKKLISGSAETYYNKGIEASIKYWGGSDADVSTYLGQDQVAYSKASGDYNQKIGIQSWLAFYNRGYEGWTVWRRLGYPILQLPFDSKNPIPYRYTYPITEQTRNSYNYTKALEAIGEDLITTKLWWNK